MFVAQSESPLLIVAIFVTGIGGTFQYGFQISVMTSPSSVNNTRVKDLVNATCEQRYGLSLGPQEINLIWSFLVSVFCIGGLLGTLCAGKLTAAYGRKRCLFLNNFVAISAAVLMLLSKTAMSFEMILVGRFLYGVNAGVSLSVHTMYLVECAPKRLRGMVGVSVATFISLGKFCGQLLGLSELLGTETGWPWLLAFCGATATLQLLSLPLLPESPRYLLLDRGDRQGCEKALRRLWGSSRDHGGEVEEMLQEHAAQQGVRTHTVLQLLLERSLRWQLATVLVTFSALQLCGINAVYLYSFDVFREAGIPAHQLRHVALGTGLCEISVSVACVMVIESTGKKLLLFRGLLCMAGTLGLLTITLYLQTQVSWMPYCSMALIFLFILFFSSGPAGVTAPLPGEIFTQSFKPAAFTVACTLNWTGLFLLGMLFPLIVEYLDYFCFLIFLCVSLLSGLFVWYNVPETKNRTVLEITADYHRMHSKTGLPEEDKHKQPEATGTVTSCTTTKL
ncbi:solute carrier family 2 member 11, like [Osmerus eperlanus]|uniref:solute carrier family 2 member 11, like n=1 Tax=Osmerus eperlanus TaxID=29151 RepID=UPI002E113EFF